MLDEHYAARRGGTATLNGVPISVDRNGDLRSGLLGMGANDRVPAALVGAMLGDLMEAGSSWIRYGSGALMLAWVAAGRLVGYAEPRMNAWDCMAGYCLIEAADGRILPFPQGDGLLRPGPVLGACDGAFDELLDITRLGDWDYWGGAGA